MKTSEKASSSTTHKANGHRPGPPPSADIILQTIRQSYFSNFSNQFNWTFLHRVPGIDFAFALVESDGGQPQLDEPPACWTENLY